MDAIQVVVNIATKARCGTGKLKEFCVWISIVIHNAFDTARWKNCIEAMMRKKVPDNLLRMTDDNLSNRWVIYEGDKWSLKEEMTGDPSSTRILFLENTKVARLMPNIGGLSEAKRKPVTIVMNSKLLYAAPVWTCTLSNLSAMLATYMLPKKAVVGIEKSSAENSLSIPNCVIARAKKTSRKEGIRKIVEIWQLRWHGEQTKK